MGVKRKWPEISLGVMWCQPEVVWGSCRGVGVNWKWSEIRPKIFVVVLA